MGDMTRRNVQQLQRALARRQQEKAELELQVRSLQSQYRDEVAPLQEEVLRLQMERLKEAAQKHVRSARLRNAFHDAQDAYEDFRERQAGPSLSRGGAEESLKTTYRRASKQCHPDAVPDSYREEAAATFQALETAYEAKHRRAVRAIADALDEWGFPQSPSVPIEDEAAPDAATLRRAVSDLNTSIEQLRSSEAFRILSESSDLDVQSLVGAQKRALKQRLRELQRKGRSRF